MENFEFNLGEHVQLVTSSEKGSVIGRAEYTNRPPQYYVRYEAGDGRQVEAWWDGDALVSIECDAPAA